MPRDFPDMKSLERAAAVHGFRVINEGEPEIHYRNELADHVVSRDMVESMEIRNGKGWDTWNDGDKKAAIGRLL